ncbi:MAG: formate/nitrite transporter family protein [Methanomassiliicoccales archaeon]|nr:formate/nitrite transporter family protein [Methanomassiliicoccales archaeon]
MVDLAGKAGVYKSKLSPGNLLLRGFMAGLYIAVGAALATVCSTGVANYLGAGIGKLVAGAVFPVGLIAIVLTGMELFTGDAMLVPMAAMMKLVTWKRVFYVWTFVYIGNFIGSLFWAFLMAVGPLQTGDISAVSGNAVSDSGFYLNAFGVNAINIAAAKTLTYKAAGGLMGMTSVFMNAIACNLLVNVAILLALSSKEMIGKFFGIWFPIMAFVASGFEHCVANMYFIPAGMMALAMHPEYSLPANTLLAHYGGITVSDFLIWNLIPATIGNIIGGFLFVGVVYFYAFRSELPTVCTSEVPGAQARKEEMK